MKLKSYFSGTVEAAMELARQELGGDALLVNARPATPETRYLGAYEVVFGVPPAQALPAAPPEPTAPDLALQMADLKRQFERFTQTVSLTQAPAPPPQDSAGLPAFEIDTTLGRPGVSRVVVALVGPPGAGKTTTLAKLAAHYGVGARKPVQILSCDVFRIGAADQLRKIASILGIGCEIAETSSALAQMLQQHRTKDLVFIDTPGLARAEMEDGAALAELMASHPEMDTHLVLPAFMRLEDMEAAAERYSVFRPRKLLFTHLDETDPYPALAGIAAQRSLPLSFFSTGQRIPDDLEAASKERLHPQRTQGAAA